MFRVTGWKVVVFRNSETRVQGVFGMMNTVAEDSSGSGEVGCIVMGGIERCHVERGVETVVEGFNGVYVWRPGNLTLNSPGSHGASSTYHH